MRVVEHSQDRLTIKRSAFFDRIIFSAAILLGIAAFFLMPAHEAPFWFRLTITGLFVVVGTIFRLLCADVIVTLDRASKTASVDWIRPIRGTKSRTVHLSQVTGLAIEGDDEAERLVFRIKGEEPLPLVPYLYTGGDHPEIKRSIDAWLLGTF